MDAKEIALLQDGFRFALSLTNNKAEAEDLIQECWIKLYEKSGSIESRSLLFTVIRNRFIDMWRKKSRRAQVGLDSIAELPQIGDDPSEQMMLRQVERAMESLSPGEREALYLQCMEEYSASEISDLTGKPRGTILSLISRGRKKLLAILGIEEKTTNVVAFTKDVL